MNSSPKLIVRIGVLFALGLSACGKLAVRTDGAHNDLPAPEKTVVPAQPTPRPPTCEIDGPDHEREALPYPAAGQTTVYRTPDLLKVFSMEGYADTVIFRMRYRQDAQIPFKSSDEMHASPARNARYSMAYIQGVTVGDGNVPVEEGKWVLLCE